MTQNRSSSVWSLTGASCLEELKNEGHIDRIPQRRPVGFDSRPKPQRPQHLRQAPIVAAVARLIDEITSHCLSRRHRTRRSVVRLDSLGRGQWRDEEIAQSRRVILTRPPPVPGPTLLPLPVPTPEPTPPPVPGPAPAVPAVPAPAPDSGVNNGSVADGGCRNHRRAPLAWARVASPRNDRRDCCRDFGRHGRTRSHTNELESLNSRPASPRPAAAAAGGTRATASHTRLRHEVGCDDGRDDEKKDRCVHKH